MSDDPHAAAILALLVAQPNLGAARVHDGKVPDTAGRPYVKVDFYIQYMGGEDLPNRSLRAIVRAYCHCVADTAEASRIVAQNVKAALLDVKPVITGRRVWPIRHEQAIPPDRDESTGVLVMDAKNIYRLDSVPA